MAIIKTVSLITAVILIAFGFYVKRQYGNKKWLDGTDNKSKKQAMVEIWIAFGSFVIAMALLYVRVLL